MVKIFQSLSASDIMSIALLYVIHTCTFVHTFFSEMSLLGLSPSMEMEPWNYEGRRLKCVCKHMNIYTCSGHEVVMKCHTIIVGTDLFDTL